MLDLHIKIKESFEFAVTNPDNQYPNGGTNWNFVEADIWMDLSKNEINNSDYSVSKIFDDLATNYLNSHT